MYKNKLVPLLFIFFLLLSGCINKNETVGEYRVYGQTYRVLKTSSKYQERGNASWYGKRFHKKRTSSGERYNMYQLTAAHKTLPLHSSVLVTNLANGRQVVVKINDRGPFVRGRLIDLSYGAAKKLGMIGMGTVPVEVKAVS